MTLDGTTVSTDWRLRERFEYLGDAVAWDVFGTGGPVVMLHGFPGNSYTWHRLAPQLGASRRVYVVDWLGFGQSTKREGQQVSQRAEAALLAALLEHWQLDAPDIVAHDVGAAIALGALLFEDRRARRLVLADAATLNPCISANSMHVRRYLEAYQTLPPALYETIMRTHVPTTMQTPMSEEVFRAYFGPWSDAEGQAAYYRFLGQLDEGYNDEVERALPRLEVPTRIVWGACDTWIPMSHAQRLRALIVGSELVTLPEAGHFIADDAPGALLEAIRTFLD